MGKMSVFRLVQAGWLLILVLLWNDPKVSGTIMTRLQVTKGVYSQVTVRVDDMEQPEDCEDFLSKLEVLLNETSHGLHELTENQSYIASIEVHLPKSWNQHQCQSRTRKVRFSQFVSNPDISVGTQSLFGSWPSQPWTEQPGGCGQSGLRVHIPMRFISTLEPFNVQSDLHTRGQSLLREWCKYRYGVFPESGVLHGGDRMYPNVYNEGNMTLVNAGCEREEPFCPLGKPYNRRAPTKQNLLCQELSAMETILNHEDFKINVTANHSVPYRAPEISFFLPKSSKYTIVLERTSVMDINGRWTNIKRAFFRFLQHLPLGSEVSIITFGKEATLNLPPTVVTDANREGLHGRIPRKVLPDDLACVFCAVNMSYNNLRRDSSDRTDSGTVILVTGSPRRPQLLEQLVAVAAGSAVKVFPIIYPGTAYPEMIKLAANARHYAVPEDDAVSSLTYLSEVLFDILHVAEGLEIQKIHETKHLSYEFAGTFTLEEEMLHHMSVTMSIDDEEKVEFFEITNPSGKKHLFSKFEDGMVVFNHPGLAQSGIWTYHAKLYPTSGLPQDQILVDVVSQSNNAEANPTFLEVFTNIDHMEADVYKTPCIIYARLTQGGQMPVINARITVRIFLPDGHPSNVVHLNLRDDGSAYPDITANDGIYSAYFTEFASVPGFYSIEATATHNEGQARTIKQQMGSKPKALSNSTNMAEDSRNPENCCGSRVEFVETLPTSPFHRQTVGTGFYIKQGISPRTDIAAPSRILDFRVSRIINDSLYVELEWSAPGGDFDKGKADKYEIRCYTNREALTNEQSFKEMGILVHDSFTPKPVAFGQRQTCTVGVPWPNEIFFYAIIASDDTGNKSPISNIISVYIPEETSSSTELPPQLASDDINQVNQQPLSEYDEYGSMTNAERERRSQQIKVYIIIGVISGLLLLILLVIFIVLIRVRTKKAEYDADERDTYKAYEPTVATKSVMLPDVVESKSVTQTAKALSNWLDSLPRSEGSPNTTAHDLSIEGGTLKRPHNAYSLSKTNPYRHKVLTNGSFLNLKDCGGSHSSHGDDSSRPTTSTEDSNPGSSQNSESGESRQSILKRSNTTSSSSKVIDTSTARAIIDTYSGNLFTRGSDQYASYRGYSNPPHGSGLFVTTPPTNPALEIDQDSLEPHINQKYPHAIPAPILSGEPGENLFILPRNSLMRTRTESVV